jgi:hypothetical protein
MTTALEEIKDVARYGSDIKIHYVGETSNEEKRMECYGGHGSHLSEIIDDR